MDDTAIGGDGAALTAGVAPDPKVLEALLAATASRHDHLCPRQVLGVRMGLAGGRLVGVQVPQADKGLFTVVETDGCGADGVSVATNCWVGHRTLRVEDYGKMAATFVNRASGRAVRVHPRAEARDRAAARAPEAEDRWQAMLLGYQRLPDAELLAWAPVELVTPVETLVSRPGARVVCAECGEEIMNEREILAGRRPLCRPCARGAYYVPASGSW